MRRVRPIIYTVMIVGALIAALVGHKAQAAGPTITPTVVNLNDDNQQIIRTDTAGNAVDAHDGDLIHAENAYWLYGTSYDCGYALETNGTPFCGFKVYRSTDLVVWTDEGFVFDAGTPTWQGRCAPPKYGCYRPHVAYNATTDKYVMWVNGYWNSTSTASGYMVLTSSTPGGPFTEIGEPTLAQQGSNSWGGSNGDHDLFVDGDGTAYVVYTRITGHVLYVEQLNADYTSGTGQHVALGATGKEAPSLFKRNGTYYVVYSSTCPYCNSGDAYVKVAPSPLTTWSAETELSNDSCGGQTAFVSKIGTEYVLGIDLWRNGADNQGLANYMWTKLSFPLTTIACPATQAITLTGSFTGVAVDPQMDQSTGEYGFRTHCDVKSSVSRVQEFVPSRNGTLTKVRLGVFKMGAVNANVAIDVVRVNSAGKPVGPVLASYAIPHGSVGSSLRMYDFAANAPVLAGNRYGFVMRSPTTAGCFGFAYSDYQPYAWGSAGYLPHSTGSWVRETTRSLKFATYVN